MARPLDWYKGRASYTNITGMSDIRRMPRAGKIRLGIRVPKKQKDSRCKHNNFPQELCGYCSFPKDSDSFIVTPEIEKVYGVQPKELDIMFPTENRDMFAPQSLKMYKGRMLFCRGNGTVATRIDQEKGIPFQMECPCNFYETGECKPQMALMFLLPSVTVRGLYQIDTTSVTNIVTINSNLDYLMMMLRRVAFVPLKLRRVPQTLQTPEGRTVTKALLSLEFEGNLADVARFRQQDSVMQLMRSPLALPPPEEEEEPPEEDNGSLIATGKFAKEEMVPPDMAEIGKMVDPDDVPPNIEGVPPVEDVTGTSEVEEEDVFIDREPGVDEEEDLPFGDEEVVEEPPPVISKEDKIRDSLRGCKSEKQLDKVFTDLVVKDDTLKPMQKFNLQAVYLEMKRIHKVKGK